MPDEENKAWVKEFWESHDVLTTPTFEFIDWVRAKQKAIDDEYWTNRLNSYAEDARKSQEALIDKAWQWMLGHIKLIGSPMELHSMFRKAMEDEQ